MRIDADLLARAIVASAVHYGDDPVRAFTVERGVLRRSLKAAAMGLHLALGGDLKTYGRLIGLDGKNLYKDRDARAVKASQAVAEAIRYALGPTWRPPSPEPLAPRRALLAKHLEPFLPELFANFPRGVGTHIMARTAGLTKTEAAEAAKELHVTKRARWVKSGQGNAKVLLPFVAPPALPGPVKSAPPAAAPERPEHQPARIPRATGEGPAGYLKLGEDDLRTRIRNTISRAGDASAMGLATMLDVKELTISTTLRAMENDGQVVGGEVDDRGMRHRRWRLLEGAME
jgi:hypothetical protein